MNVKERQVSPLSDKDVVGSLKSCARKVILEVSLDSSNPKAYNKDMTKDAMRYFDSLFLQGRAPQALDEKFLPEISYSQSLRLSPEDRMRARRILDEELLAWNMELFHPGKPNALVPDPVFEHIPSSGKLYDAGVWAMDAKALKDELYRFAERHRGSVAFAMLKGGMAGGLNPVASSSIRDMLRGLGSEKGKASKVFFGTPSELTFKDFVDRWGEAPAKVKQYQRMWDEATPEGKGHMEKVMGGRISQMQEGEYKAWCDELSRNGERWKIGPDDVAMIIDSTEYSLSGVQELMLVFGKPLEGGSNAQDYLKRMIGATNPMAAEDGTVRAKMREELDLADRTRYPMIRNVIHCPTSGEQRLEVDLMADDDVRFFVSAARRLGKGKVR